MNSERWERIQSLFHDAVDNRPVRLSWLKRARENLVKLYTV